MSKQDSTVMVALSGGVDSAVAALLLTRQGRHVECLHMTNWEDDDGYCQAAQDFQDARRTADHLGLTLHRANFTREYRDAVFEEFVAAHRRGETPNPDVYCNREIKFGVMRDYARRLGAATLATGHYARSGTRDGARVLLRARDQTKDQTYFLHAIAGDSLTNVVFPLGDARKTEVRRLASSFDLPVADKRDSTGICFIGERPFAEFLGRYVEREPGPIVTLEGERVGTHDGLAFYTLGQRHGLALGGRRGHGSAPWYVADKRQDSNELVVVQSSDHPHLFQRELTANDINWIGPVPVGYEHGEQIRATAKTRYRQADTPCTFLRLDSDRLRLTFDQPQRSITPGQSVVIYSGDRCLGGGRIASTTQLL